MKYKNCKNKKQYFFCFTSRVFYKHTDAHKLTHSVENVQAPH